MNDPELKAMQEVFSILEQLENDAQQRVIGWVIGKLKLNAPLNLFKPIDSSSPRGSTHPGTEHQITSFESIGDLFSVVSPRTDIEKVLVVSAFLQEKHQKDELTGREINKELHHLGHRVGNVTVAISNLMKRKPQLMIQTKKDGKSQQANKKYKVSIEGLRAVREMIKIDEN